ncbi:MAG: T9SS type A sorting domain-containing protein [Chitinophagaceae bacterium]|jgi:hypothetical protein|nr:T9SS type A sorting domain-containing protein [Chitinophagaceae bacterium]
MKQLYTLGILTLFTFGTSFVPDRAVTGEWLETQTKVLRFYPNPATSFISFEFDKSVDKTYTLQVYNFIGRKMTDVRITDSKITLNLDDQYLRGLYIYQLRDQSSRIIESGKFQVSK